VKRLSAFLLALGALMLAQLDPVMADGYYRHYRHHAARVAYAGPGPDYAYGGVCSEGWWQTLRYGHVRPQWGVRCLRGGRRRHID
jgi:hypothetical protein